MKRSFRASKSTTTRYRDTTNSIVAAIAIMLILFLPLLRGGNRQVAIALALLPSLVGAAVIAANEMARYFCQSQINNTSNLHKHTRSGLDLIGIFSGYSILLILYGIYWYKVPNLTGINVGLDGNRSGILRDPIASSLASLTPAVLLFAAAIFVTMRTLTTILAIVLLSGILQIAICLGQIALGEESILYFETKFARDLIGTFNNRNHLASYLSIGIPIVFYFWYRASDANVLHAQARNYATIIKVALATYGFSLIAVILATQSRGGLLSAATSTILSLFIYTILAKQRRKLTIAILTCGMIASAASLIGGVIGFEKVTTRLGLETVIEASEIRSLYTRSTIDAAIANWPLGTGPGSFEGVFPRYQHVESLGFISYAHNDYAQATMEYGIFALAIGGTLMLLILHRAYIVLKYAVRSKSRSDAETSLRCFVLAALFPAAVHASFEFIFHIPTITALVAFCAGILFRDSGKSPHNTASIVS